MNKPELVSPLDQHTEQIPSPLDQHRSQTENARKSRRCIYVRPNGRRCGSAATRESEFCYYHGYRPGSGAHFPVMEDGLAIQAALRDVLNDTITGAIDSRTSWLLLYGLQIACANLRHIRVCDYLTERDDDAVATEEKVERWFHGNDRDDG